MKSGTCFKCNAKTVYKLKNGIGESTSQCIMVGSWSRSVTEFDCYLCTSCGYMENYVIKQEHLEAVVRGDGKWTKV